MTDTSTPIVVTTGALPATAASVLRYALTTLGGYLVARGWLAGDTAEMLTTVILVIAPLVYGAWLTQHNKARLVTVAEAAPDSVAVVK